jgi:ubiquinone/menaquinone biosynthesis C-methylase UbiE
MTIWDKIWDERGRAFPKDDALELNGFDQEFGKIGKESFLSICKEIERELSLQKDDAILDFGCGSGVYVNHFAENSKDIRGVDLSKDMITRAAGLYPGKQFFQEESDNLPFESNSIDKIYCHSVFQYFSSEAYAKGVIDELKRVLKPGGKILIMDVMDLSKKESYLKFRSSFSESPQWKSSIKGEVTHRYYKKSFFNHLGKDLGVRCEVKDRDVNNYLNGKFRFNVLLSDDKK